MINKKRTARFKAQFARTRHISKEVCRVLAFVKMDTALVSKFDKQEMNKRLPRVRGDDAEGDALGRRAVACCRRFVNFIC